MADEVAVLKLKLKKANANHEKLVAEWAHQGADIQKELDNEKQALSETFTELQAVREKLRRHEKKGSEAAAAILTQELKRAEESRSLREDELTAEISSLKDALRREVLAKMEVRHAYESRMTLCTLTSTVHPRLIRSWTRAALRRRSEALRRRWLLTRRHGSVWL